MESDTEEVSIEALGSVYTSISSHWQSPHPSIWSLWHDISCIWNGQTPRTLHVKQTAVCECKRLGGGELCNAMHCETIGWSPTPSDIRDVLENCYAEKQHSVYKISHTHKYDLENGILMQLPTLHSTPLNWYHVRAHVIIGKSQFSQWARDNIAEH